MAFIILSIVGMALSVAMSGIQSSVATKGSQLSQKITQAVNDVVKAINNKQIDLEKLTEAYTSKNSDLITALMSGSGFGSRAISIMSEISNARENFNKAKQEVQEQISELNSKANELQNMANRAGTSIGSNKQAQEALDKFNKDGINQLVDGGAKEGGNVENVIPQK